MKYFGSALILLILLALGLPDALATLSNPEDFESYTPVYDLLTSDGWSSDGAGTTDPVAADHDVITGNTLKMDNGNPENNNDIYWQQPVFVDMSQTLSYDIKLTDVYEDSWGGYQRGSVGPDDGGYHNEAFHAQLIITGSGSSVVLWTRPDEHTVPGGSISLDTWYSVQVEFDSGVAQTVRMRFKERDAASWNDWTETVSMGVDPDGMPIRIFANDVVYFDNISLTPEPATVGLLVVGGLGMLLRRKR